MIDWEDLNILKNQKANLYFILGGPGSDRRNQCNKLVSEFKFVFISIADAIREEIQKDSKLGEACHQYDDKDLLPTDLTVAILIKAILSRKGTNYIIDGFPRSIEQAKFFDQNVKEIKHIINLVAKDEVMFSRIKGNKLKIKKFLEQKNEVISYYDKFGIVKHVDANSADTNLIYSSLKSKFLPEIHLIVGKRYSGKTSVSELLSQRMSFEIINFNDIYKDPEAMKRKGDNEYIINYFYKNVRERQLERILINDFPPSSEFFKLFIKNGREVKSVIYLNADNNTCVSRMRSMYKQGKKTVGTSKLNEELYDFEQNLPIIDFYKQRTKLIEINANNGINLVLRDLMRSIQPDVLLFSSDKEGVNIKTDLINYFVSKKGYEILNVSNLVTDSIQRGNEIGLTFKRYSENMQQIPNKYLIDLFKSVIFKETNDKFIIVNYPRNAEDIIEFERDICEIKKNIFVATSVPLNIPNSNSTAETVEVYFKKKNKLFVYNKNQVDNYKVDEILDKNKDINIVYGMPYSGKTFVTRKLAENNGYTKLDIAEFIDKVKEIIAGPEGDKESVTLEFPAFIEEYKKKIDSLPTNRKIIIDNFTKIITKEEEMEKFLEVTGPIRIFYNLICDEIPLIDRFKTITQAEGDWTDEQKEEYIQNNFTLPRAYLEMIKSRSVTITEINTNNSEPKTAEILTQLLGKKVISIVHDYNLEIEKTLNLLAATHRILYVNVPDLIKRQYDENNSWSVKLKNTYSEKMLLRDKTLCSKEELLYYDYNPIHFQDKVVLDLIRDYTNENSKENEESKNIVVLSGYLNYNLLSKLEQSFNLPLFEIKDLLTIGEIASFVQIGKAEVETFEKEVPFKKEPEVVVVVKKKKKVDDEGNEIEGEDGEEDMEGGENMEEVDPDAKPPFKPEDYAWTSYNANPRNYIQILHKYTKNKLDDFSIRVLEYQEILYKTISKAILDDEQVISLIHVRDS